MNSKLNHFKEAETASLNSILERALRYHRQGDLEQAENHYREILVAMPMNADALHLLGVLYNQKGDSQAAIDLITRAIQNFPDQPIYHNNLGNAYRDCGRYDGAVACYQKALQIKPDLVEAYLNLGITYHQTADFDRAAATFQKTITLRPECAEAHYNLGNTLKEQGYYSEAIRCYQQAASINPMLVDAPYNQAKIMEQQGRLDEALVCLRQCVESKPDWAEAHSNLGNVFKQLGSLDAALSHYQKAINLKPDLFEAHNNAGNAFKDQGSFEIAIACYRRCLRINPTSADAYLNLGITYAEADRWDDAIECFQKSIQIDARSAAAHNYMGVVLAEKGLRDHAIGCFQNAIEIRPDYREAYSYLIHQLQHTCSWSSLRIYSEKLEELRNRSGEEHPNFIEPPFISLTRHSDSYRQLTIAKEWSRKIAQPLQNLKLPFSFGDRLQKKPKLAIGYLSGDFHDHATAHLMLSLFELHNRGQFKVLCYSYGPDDNSFYRKRIVSNCDEFVDIRRHSHVDAARHIYADGIDILVDLKGHTKGARLGILACRPAPLQVHYLGYPGTSGADFIDYLITDKIVTPFGHAPFYSEKLVFLPDCYQVNDHHQDIAPCVWQKTDMGLPPDSFVFSSFNLSYKIDPVMFDCWMRVLNRTSRSVLWLLDAGETMKKNLNQEARSRGIDPRRLVFADKLPKAEHLARMRLADLALDTRLVNGHTTTSDALWAGVPVLTLQGENFAARVSASLLNAVGLSELTTHNLDDYENIAVRLASQPDELENFKTKLWSNRLTKPLFDTAGFVEHLESAYQQMWRLLSAGQAPQQIEVFKR